MQADQINENEMKLEFDARSVNEGFARMAVAAFVAELNPTLDEISDIKTAVSEAVTNAIIHGYDSPEEKVEVSCKLCGNHAEITVKDHGHGIADVQKAMEPFFTTRPELERSGMGFAFIPCGPRSRCSQRWRPASAAARRARPPAAAHI